MSVDGLDEPAHELLARYLEIRLVSAVVHIRLKIDDFFSSIAVDDQVVLQFLSRDLLSFHKQKIEVDGHIALCCFSEILCNFYQLAINELISM